MKKDDDMARKAATKSTEINVSETLTEEVSNIMNEESISLSASAISQEEVKIVESKTTVGHLKLDDINEIFIEKSSDFWVYAYWSDGNVSSLIVSFEINHSTTYEDILKSVRRYARDRFTYLAEKTFVAQ